MKFNINHHVTITLNSRGADILNIGNPERPFKAGDKYSNQLWIIMERFGQFVFMGPEPPFETEIDLEIEKPHPGTGL